MIKILVIDDDPDVRLVVSRLLQKEGYAVVTASQPAEARQKIAQENPSLILLDVLLSGSDGRQLCRELKSGGQTQNIPIIMVSGHPGAAVAYKDWGANDFLAKPIQVGRLLETLSRQLAASREGCSFES